MTLFWKKVYDSNENIVYKKIYVLLPIAHTELQYYYNQVFMGCDMLCKVFTGKVVHIGLNAGAVILKVAYSYQVKTDNDKWVKMIEKAFALEAGISMLGKLYVEMFPIYKSLLLVNKRRAGFRHKAEEVEKTACSTANRNP
ncbi:hypothetical protein BDQ12DRAFT_668981 [Crucibulum laeve]|uniref:Uncharacterized protein n=1 Tax=Crucibulum laeve TaxID=68775 RepID=A0A5C3LRL3_9AGAR|nr:hypothetical protein BDQ12DRAFT_668981 [Crucibulum laeve]